MASGTKRLYRFSSKSLVVPALLAGAILVRSWSFFRPDATLSIFIDNTYTFHPLFHYINAVLANGELPIWIRTLLGGLPIYNSPQFSFFYPFYFLWKPELYSTPTDAIQVVTWVTYLHLWVCSFNMLFFLRTMGVGRYGAILGSVAFAFGACMACYGHAVTVIASYCWVPLAISGVHLIFVRRGSVGAISLTAISFSLTAMATPSQSLIHAFMLASLHIVASTALLAQRGRTDEIKVAFLRLSIAAALSLAIVSPNLITMAVNQNEIRWLSAAGYMIGRGAVPYAAFLEDQSSIFELLNVLVPIRVNVAGDSFVGILVLAFATIGVLWRWRSPFVICYGGAAVYFWLSSTGSHLGLSFINYQIPLLNAIRQPSRNLFIVSFAVAYLAAVGFDVMKSNLIRSEKNNNPAFTAAIASIFAFYSLIAVLTATVMNYHNVLIATIVGGGLLLIVGLIWAGPNLRQSWLPPKVLIAALFFLSFGVWFCEQPTWPTASISNSDYADYDNLRMHLALERIEQIPDQSLFKTRFLSDGDEPHDVELMRFAMDAVWHDVRTFNAWLNPMPNFKVFEDVMDFGNRPEEFYRRLGARYILCTRCVQPIAAHFSYIAEVGGYSIYEDTAALPDYWIGRPTVSQASENAVSLTKPTSVSEADLASLAGKYMADPVCMPNVEHRRHNSFRISVGCTVPGLLVFNEFLSPEWKVSLNGKAIAPLLVNGFQLGVPLQQGSNLIEFRYDPLLYMVLLKLSAVAGLVIFVLLVSMIWRCAKIIGRPPLMVRGRC